MTSPTEFWHHASLLRIFARAIGVLALLLLVSPTPALSQNPEDYPTPPEAEKQEGVPEGKVEGPFLLSSEIYPGTERKYWLYIPHQYDPATPACSIIVQDGLNRAAEWRLPQICDNLIHANEMPVTIGIFVSPGVVPALTPDAQPRFNRSFEYDALGDTYARFLLEELIPEVSANYNLSTNPNDRAIAGASSGGICAFNAAWERPDAFRRVLSTIGTFVGLRGGNAFPVLVRKVEPKPLRIFLQDGSEDLNIYAGDWWIANQDMLSSLQWAGYDVKHAWGEGGHNGKHAAAIMPEALRWLWRDYPEPIKIPTSTATERRTNIILPGVDWQEISSGHQLADAPTCDAAGNLHFCDARAGRVYRVGEDGKTRIFKDQSGRVTSMSFAPDGKLYAARDSKQVVRFATDGSEEIVLAEAKCNRIVTMPTGFYYSDDTTPALNWSTYDGKVTTATQLLEPVAALTPTADHGFMHLAAKNKQSTTHFQISPGGFLNQRQSYGYLHLPYLELSSGAGGMAVDNQGNCYIASTLGIQVMDQLGRVQLILRKPSKSPITGLAFGGAMRDVLYVTAGENVYARKLATRGVATFEPPTKLPEPKL